MILKKILKTCSVFILLTIIFISSFHLSRAQSSTSSGNASTFIDYKNISSFDGSEETTKIESAGTNGVNGLVNHLLFYGVIVITALVIFRILYGGFLKGTYDNIYDQNKGKQSIKVAGFALLILIFSYAVLSFINPRLTGWTLAVNNFKVNVPDNGLAATVAGICKIDSSYNQMSITDEIKYDEQGKNFAATAYQDTANNHNLTIGWGFNLEQAGAENYLKSANLDQTKINGLVSCAKDKNVSECPTINQSEADSIFQVSVNNAQSIAVAWANKNYSNGYNSLPTNIQKALINMAYNIGSFASFKNSGDTRKGLDKIISGDKTGIDQMAKGIAEADYCGQVKTRCARILGLIYSAYGGSCPVINTQNSNSLSGQTVVPAASKEKASDILKLYEQGKITFGCISSDTDCQKPEALHEIQQTSLGNQVIGNCTSNSISLAPKTIDPKILNFLDILGNTGTYQINAIANGCHTDTSLHYYGDAVDLQCSWDGKETTGSTPPADMLAAAQSAGVAFYSGETCANSYHHWHFSTTGN